MNGISEVDQPVDNIEAVALSARISSGGVTEDRLNDVSRPWLDGAPVWLPPMGCIVTSSVVRPNFLTTCRDRRALKSPGRVTPMDFPLRSSGRRISFRATMT